MPLRLVLLPMALLSAAPVLAEDVVRLSAADRKAALEAAATAPINGAPGAGDGKIHGEMGMAIGTGGMRSVYGSTVIPLGQTGTLGLAFDTTQFGRPRAR